MLGMEVWRYGDREGVKEGGREGGREVGSVGGRKGVERKREGEWSEREGERCNILQTFQTYNIQLYICLNNLYNKAIILCTVCVTHMRPINPLENKSNCKHK